MIVTRTDARSVDCPACGALADQLCTTTHSHTKRLYPRTSCHAERWAAYRAARDAEAAPSPPTTLSAPLTRGEVKALRWAAQQAAVWRGYLIGNPNRTALEQFDAQMRVIKAAMKKLAAGATAPSELTADAISLRDRFAMAALTGDWAIIGRVAGAEALETRAALCYQMADAMLKARSVK